MISFTCITMLTASVFFSGSLQDKLLYYPDRSVPGDRELSLEGLRFWPSGREGYRGFVGQDPEGKKRGTVIVLHGNAATAAERLYYLEPFHRLGYRVLLAEYPGYGGRKGTPGEKVFIADARETMRVAYQMYGAPIYLLGESLGGAVAASAVREQGVPVAAMILVTPWATLEKVAAEKFPFLPVRLLMTDRYDTVANLKEFRGPVAVVAAEKDEIVPPHHARELYQSLSGRKKMWTISGVGHNDWPEAITFAQWQEIMQFVTEGEPEGQRKVK